MRWTLQNINNKYTPHMLNVPDIALKGVKKSYKDVQAVKGIDIEIQKGEFVALLGPNGAGKTTLVEMIEGIRTPDEGEILIQGIGWKGNTHKLNRKIGLSLQETYFIDKLTVYETLRLFGTFYGLKKNRVNEILELVDLQSKSKAYVVNLSGGQRQRLTLGIAILNNPEILLLDEPTTGLDPTARRELWKILRQLSHEHNTTLILTTHYMEEAEYLCERIIIMDNGKILSQGTLNELLLQNNCGEVIEFSFAEEVAPEYFLSTYAWAKAEFDTRTGMATMNVDNAVNHLPALFEYCKQQNLHLKSVESRKKTLDDLFISMTGRHLAE
jgi:ABC-2 type transport system ATP-binding protein